MGGRLPKVSVVVITYNRLITLRPTIASFLRHTDYPRELLELILTDDGSPEAVQSELRRLPFDKFCLSKKRSGLGANTNRGLEAATADFILHLQDDWECCGPSDYLRKAVSILQARPDIGLLTLHRHDSLPTPTEVAEVEGETLRIFSGIADASEAASGRYAYSDRPHLKTRAFMGGMGRYNEKLNVAFTEVDFCRRFAGQDRVALADLNGKAFFLNIGEEHSYNWPWKKRVESWITRLPGGEMAMRLYRRYKRGGARRVSEG